jgi:LEA14-like dessication related protein
VSGHRGIEVAPHSRMKTHIVLSAVVALGFTSCSTAPKTVERPEVSLQSLDIDKASLTEATILLKLAVKNPNAFDLDIDSLKYGLSVDGKPFASGTTQGASSVAANAETEVVVPLRMKYWDLYKRFSDLAKNTGKPSQYSIQGNVMSDGKEYPFEHSGEVKLPKSDEKNLKEKPSA